MNYVLDTHVWIAFFHSHRLEEIIYNINLSQHKIFSCTEQVKEFHDVHLKHLKISKMLPEKTSVYVEIIRLTSVELETSKKYRLLIDYKDNYLVDLSNISRSTLVSNDKGFSFLRKLRSPDIRLISIQEFYKEIGL